MNADFSMRRRKHYNIHFFLNCFRSVSISARLATTESIVYKTNGCEHRKNVILSKFAMSPLCNRISHYGDRIVKPRYQIPHCHSTISLTVPFSANSNILGLRVHLIPSLITAFVTLDIYGASMMFFCPSPPIDII